jgi:hypothetical protein
MDHQTLAITLATSNKKTIYTIKSGLRSIRVSVRQSSPGAGGERTGLGCAGGAGRCLTGGFKPGSSMTSGAASSEAKISPT